MGTLGGAIISNIPVIGNVAQSLIDSFQQRSNVDRTNQANKELAQYQYSKDLEMWNKGNAYNAPQAQMQRLKDAGLNPNLVYGSGAVAGQSAGQLPKYQAPTMSYNYHPPVNIPSAIGTYQDFAIKQAQTDNLNAQRQAIVADTEIKKLEAIKRLTENKYLDENLSQRNSIQGYNIGGKIQQQSIQQQDFVRKQLENRLLEGKMPYQLDSMELANRLKRQQLTQQAGLYGGKLLKQGLENKYQAIKNTQAIPGFDLSQLLKTNQNSKIIQDTENMRLRNEYFVTQLFGKMGLDVLGKFKGGPLQRPEINKIPPRKGGPLQRPEINKIPPRLNRPAMYQRKGYGARK